MYSFKYRIHENIIKSFVCRSAVMNQSGVRTTAANIVTGKKFTRYQFKSFIYMHFFKLSFPGFDLR